ncbi:MAG: hypothetical protein KGH64_04910 [Candidatus Micrarchaeota archaeon]|nr:hypothetical protein [Candidatus Micrarchaeota archaeon]
MESSAIAALIAIIIAGAVAFVLLTSNHQSTGNQASSLQPTTTPAAGNAGANTTVTTSATTVSSNTSNRTTSNYTAALNDCSKAGIPASQCQSYCQGNPSACGFSNPQGNGQQSSGSSHNSEPTACTNQGLLPQQCTSYCNSNPSQCSSSGGIQSGSAVNHTNSSAQQNYGNLHNNSTGNQTSQGSIASMLPACQNQTYLTSLPTNLSSIAYMTPLGSLNPAGGHPIPSDHGGVGLFTSNGHSLPATVYSPGNVTVLQIVTQNSTINGKTFMDDAIYFAPCRQLVFYYGHVATLSIALQQEVKNASKNAYCQHNQQSNATSTTCTYAFNYNAKAGEVLGTAGGPNTNILGFDFGGYDLRTPAPAFIDPTRQFNDFGRPINTICPVNYFTTNLQSLLYPKFNNTQKGPNGYPSCGTDMYDVPSTIQGNWYLSGSLATGEAVWSQQLSIVHWYENPSIGVLSFGGTVAQASMNAFTPTESGYINREPSQVTADGHLYCYYPNNLNTSYGLSPLNGGHFILQLVDSNTLKIEYQNGSCLQNFAFTSPITYIR